MRTSGKTAQSLIMGSHRSGCADGGQAAIRCYPEAPMLSRRRLLWLLFSLACGSVTAHAESADRTGQERQSERQSTAAAAPAPAAMPDHFAEEHVSIDLHWMTGVVQRAHITAFDLQGLDFIFVIAFFCGLYALHRLLAVSEVGEVEEDVVVTELYGEGAQLMRRVSTVPGGAVKGAAGVVTSALRSGSRQRPSPLEAEITQELSNAANAVKR
jgi:hypothetical protein